MSAVQFPEVWRAFLVGGQGGFVNLGCFVHFKGVWKPQQCEPYLFQAVSCFFLGKGSPPPSASPQDWEQDTFKIPLRQAGSANLWSELSLFCHTLTVSMWGWDPGSPSRTHALLRAPHGHFQAWH